MTAIHLGKLSATYPSVPLLRSPGDTDHDRAHMLGPPPTREPT